MSLFTQNAKMKKSSDSKYDVYNFGIPAFMSQSGIKTCPNAGACAAGCYARSGTYGFSNVKNAYESRLEATLSDDFITVAQNEINKLKAKCIKSGKQLVIRIHDSGDFYNLEYFQSWNTLANVNSDVIFYAYTKQVEMLKLYVNKTRIKLTFSLGGKQDSLIDTEKMRHAKVFESQQDLIDAGYIDATQDDMITAIGLNNKIGLVYHGVKKYSNTAWDRVVTK